MVHVLSVLCRKDVHSAKWFYGSTVVPRKKYYDCGNIHQKNDFCPVRGERLPAGN